jgi:hypothetical protein
MNPVGTILTIAACVPLLASSNPLGGTRAPDPMQLAAAGRAAATAQVALSRDTGRTTSDSGLPVFADGFESGAACAWSSVVSPFIPGGCVIDGACFAPGETDPADTCRICDPTLSETGWTALPDGASCDDGDLCTVGNQCISGSCSVGAPANCNDALPCTLDMCDPVLGCQHIIAPGACLISGVCYTHGTPNPGNACQVCNSTADPTAFSNALPGTVCAPGFCVSATVASLPDVCNGSGVCLDGGTQDCTPYRCSGVSCLTSCSTDDDCVDTHFCDGSSCVPYPTSASTGSAAIPPATIPGSTETFRRSSAPVPRSRPAP